MTKYLTTLLSSVGGQHHLRPPFTDDTIKPSIITPSTTITPATP